MLIKEKWKAKDEWNRLSAEKEVFRQDQKFILERLERQKAEVESTKASYVKLPGKKGAKRVHKSGND